MNTETFDLINGLLKGAAVDVDTGTEEHALAVKLAETGAIKLHKFDNLTTRVRLFPKRW